MELVRPEPWGTLDKLVEDGLLSKEGADKIGGMVVVGNLTILAHLRKLSEFSVEYPAVSGAIIMILAAAVLYLGYRSSSE